MAEPSTSTHPTASSPGDVTESQCNETINLLGNEPPQRAQAVPGAYVDVKRVLPLSLTLSLGMAATAATTVFAYAVIICADPAHCDADQEKGAYSGAVAVATGIANLCGALVLGPLQAVVRLNLKAGLFAWIAARILSVCVLWIAGTDSTYEGPVNRSGSATVADVTVQSSIEAWPLRLWVASSKASLRITCYTTTSVPFLYRLHRTRSAFHVSWGPLWPCIWLEWP